MAATAEQIQDLESPSLSPIASTGRGPGGRYDDLSKLDELDLFVFSFRGEIELMEVEIKQLDAAIEADKATIRTTKATLDDRFRRRARLVRLREAMLRFVVELERLDHHVASE